MGLAALYMKGHKMNDVKAHTIKLLIIKYMYQQDNKHYHFRPIRSLNFPISNDIKSYCK